MTQSISPQQAPHQPYAPTPPTNTMAILSLVFAFLFWPLAIVFGHMARKQIARTGEAGRGLATAGLVISYVGMAFVVLLMVVFAAAAGSADGPLTGSGPTSSRSASTTLPATVSARPTGPATPWLRGSPRTQSCSASAPKVSRAVSSRT